MLRVLDSVSSDPETSSNLKRVTLSLQQTDVNLGLFRHFLWLFSLLKRPHAVPMYVQRCLYFNLENKSEYGIEKHLTNLKMAFQALSLCRKALDCYLLLTHFSKKQLEFVPFALLVEVFFGREFVEGFAQSLKESRAKKKTLLIGYLALLFSNRRSGLGFFVMKLNAEDEDLLESFLKVMSNYRPKRQFGSGKHLRCTLRLLILRKRSLGDLVASAAVLLEPGARPRKGAIAARVRLGRQF